MLTRLWTTTAFRWAWAAPLLACWLLLGASRAVAYSVLSHEAVVDLAWKDQLEPLLLARFPATTPDQLKQAHAYAYGGCIIQDLGYYPFGNHFFSDLLHYVRTGDFVANLLADASDANEYAFALGALAHYTADSYGHPAVNLATSQEYPKLRRKYGKVVTYDQNPTAHLQTEFGFDVVEVAHNRYAPEQYHDFIGFQVSKALLERAFRETYGFEVDKVLTHEDLAISTYRSTVSGLLPKMTKVALVTFGKQIQKDDPSFDRRKLLYRVRRADFEKEYGRDYQKPGFGSRFLAFFIGILPKVGPLKALALHLPDGDTQKTFDEGMNSTLDHYRAYIAQVKTLDGRRFELPSRDLDTGEPTAPGEYRLADFTYAKLLDQVVKQHSATIPAELLPSLVAYYRPGEKNYVETKPKEWAQVQSDLKLLSQMPVAPALSQPGSATADPSQSSSQN
jgi:hypothetical protein